MPVNIGVNIQRSPNRINQQLREAGVEGKFPKLLLDFKDEYYLASGGSKTLANAVTHARSGNAVMTDGYGPELVTNGGFDSDTGFTKGDGWSIRDGHAYCDGSQSAASNLAQTVTIPSAGTYIFEFNVVDATTSSVGISFVGGGTATTTSTGTYASRNTKGKLSRVFVFSSGGTFTITAGAFSTFVGAVDNFTFREMPVLKWAPHNLLTHSEQFDNAAWSSTGTVTVTANAATAPDGTATADRVVTSGASALTQSVVQQLNHTIEVWVKAVTAGSNNTFRLQGTGGKLSSNLTATGDWQLFSFTPTTLGTNGNWGLNRDSSNNAMDLYVWGAHVYRSDLGGMVDNPDRGDSYVPTTSSAKYLSRVGHHVFNGSAWVNEGLLAESEARTNLVPYSDFSSAWADAAADTLTTNAGIAPDGTDDAIEFDLDSSGFLYAIVSVSASTEYTFSWYVKAGTATAHVYGFYDETNTTFIERTQYSITDGEDIGNGWYRQSHTVTTPSGCTSLRVYPLRETDGSGAVSGTIGTTFLYGAQVEQASTPSSLIPTSGSTVTRAAETFTIPSANLPWPSPNYIGSERLTGSWAVPTGYDNTVSGTGTSVVATGGTTTSRCFLEIDGVDAGEVYQVTLTVNSTSVGNVAVYLRDSSTGSGTILLTQTAIPEGTTFVGHVAAASGVMSALLVGSTGADFDVDISVREIDPLSVSIAMDGRITYADEGATNTATLLYWRVDSENFIRHRLRTDAANVGQLQVMQESNDVNDGKATQYLEPDVLVAYSYATRHGSTFLNLGTDGVSLTANTAPTELVDLSATDLELAQDYMGTVGTFRIWDRDIADTGLVEATNPSLEPSLSLTFEGTGTNSFVVNDWSE